MVRDCPHSGSKQNGACVMIRSRLIVVPLIALGAAGACANQGDVAKEDPVSVPPEVVDWFGSIGRRIPGSKFLKAAQ